MIIRERERERGIACLLFLPPNRCLKRLFLLWGKRMRDCWCSQRSGGTSFTFDFFSCIYIFCTDFLHSQMHEILLTNSKAFKGTGFLVKWSEGKPFCFCMRWWTEPICLLRYTYMHEKSFDPWTWLDHKHLPALNSAFTSYHDDYSDVLKITNSEFALL